MKRTSKGDWLYEHPWGAVVTVFVSAGAACLPSILLNGGVGRYSGISVWILAVATVGAMWWKPGGFIRKRYKRLLDRSEKDASPPT